MSDFNPCKFYGHKWERQPAQSARLPPGYSVEKCSWCGRERSVMNQTL